MKGVYVHKAKDVCNDIIDHIENKKPFAIQRLGDGYYQIIEKYLMKGDKEIQEIRCITQGVHPNNQKEIINMMVDGANKSNYVSQFDTMLPDLECNGYYTHVNGAYIQMLSIWKDVYKKIGITNTNYINPFIHFHLFLKDKKNLFDYIKHKKICLICAEPKAVENLQKAGVDVIMIDIPQQTTKQEYIKHQMKIPLCNEWHYDKYEQIKEQIKNNINKCDVFLIAAGLLGKGYSTYVKELGGVSVDIGKMIHIWANNNKNLNVLNHGYFERSLDGFSLKLTEKGKMLTI